MARLTLGWILCALVAFACCAQPARAAIIPPLAVKNLAAWYDASDTSTQTTVTQAAGAVAKWADKSGNGWTLYQSVLANQPTRVSSGINGLGSMVFNGATPGFSTVAAIPNASFYSTDSVFVVQNATNNSGVTVAAATGGQWDFGASQFLFYGNTVNYPSAPTGTHLWSGVGDLNGGTLLLRLDGNTVASQVPVNAPTPASDCQLTVGSGYTASCSSTSTQFFTGQIGEVVVVSSALTAVQYSMVEGYLACKWGLQSSLPVSHPYHSVCPSGYSPTSLGSLLAWYDASDASTVTSGLTYVTQMTDKSGNANTLTSTTPPSVVTVNGLQSIAFNGNQRLSSSATNTVAAGSNPSSIFVVASAPGAQNGYGVATMYGTPTVQTARMIFSNAAYKVVSSEWTNDLAGVPQWSRTTGPTLTFASYGSSTETLATNGNTLLSATHTPATTASTAFTLGAAAAVNGTWYWFWNGPIDEVLVYNSALSLSEQQFLEGYLACKWSLQGNLPAGHPFKSACPTSATANLTLTLAASATTVVPGTVITYTTTFTNSSGTIVYSPVVITPIPPNSDLQLASAATSLGSTGLTPSIAYSNNGGTTFTYTPVSGAGGAAAGYDRTVTHVRWTLSGALGSVSSANSGSASYAVRIR